MLQTLVRSVADADVAAYERDGVFLLKNAFAPEWVELMTGSIEEVLASPRERGSNLSGEWSSP